MRVQEGAPGCPFGNFVFLSLCCLLLLDFGQFHLLDVCKELANQNLNSEIKSGLDT